MCDLFLQSELQIWLTPLYHGGMTGMMKNCLDWLELTARLEKPYLTDKVDRAGGLGRRRAGDAGH